MPYPNRRTRGRHSLVGFVALLVAVAAALGPVGAPVAAAENPEPISAGSAWGQTSRETPLWSGPDDRAKEFFKLPASVTLQVLELGSQRAFVYFSGDRQGHKPGEAWVNRADLAAAAWPQWVRARRNTEIRPEASPAGPGTMALPPGTYIETTGETKGRWAKAYYLGDGRLQEAVEGWIDGVDVALPSADQATLSGFLISRGLLATRAPEIWLRVPYRSQLDTTEYAQANCGPTTVGMVLEAFGQMYGQATLRSAAMRLQDTDNCDECGVFVQNLAALTQARGVRVFGLHADGSGPIPVTDDGTEDEGNLRRWTLDDIRAELRAGHVVVPQVKFRSLPGRATTTYGGDHFVAITGMIGDRFIVNDPIDSDGRGYGRMIAADSLERAMALATVPRVAFAAGR